MRIARRISTVLACLLISVGLVASVSAAEISAYSHKQMIVSSGTPFATGSFSFTLPARSQGSASDTFPLAAGETVTIKASYSPFSANVDFGLVAPNGSYYYFNVTDGSIDKTILISESGDYTLQIRNNSSMEVEVAGFVNY